MSVNPLDPRIGQNAPVTPLPFPTTPPPTFWQNLIQGMTRAEVIFTAVGVALPQIISFSNDASLNHVAAGGLSATVIAIFTAFEAIKDGWNRKQT